MTVTREEALEIFARRRATRAYDPDRRVSDEDFAAILEFARLSPSSVGTEPWKFLVIQDPELREKLKPIAWGMAGQLDAASHLVVLLAKKGLRYDTPWMHRTLEGRNLTEEQMEAALERYSYFQKNCIKVLESDRALFDWASKQTYIALGNMMTGAAMLGIDSCPIEGMDYDAERVASFCWPVRPGGVRRVRGCDFRLSRPRDRAEEPPPHRGPGHLGLGSAGLLARAIGWGVCARCLCWMLKLGVQVRRSSRHP